MPSGWVPGRFRLAKRTAADEGKNQLVKGMHAFDFLFPPIPWPVCIKVLDGGLQVVEKTKVLKLQTETLRTMYVQHKS